MTSIPAKILGITTQVDRLKVEGRREERIPLVIAPFFVIANKVKQSNSYEGWKPEGKSFLPKSLQPSVYLPFKNDEP